MLSQIENKILQKIEERSGIELSDKSRFSTQYYWQDNFTTCIMVDDDRRILGVGVSKRNPIDSISNGIGAKRAFNRTVRSIIGYYAK